MAKCGAGQGKYTVFINGGNANIGYKAKMTLYCGGRRGYCTKSLKSTTKITGAGQLLEQVHVKVLHEIVIALNCPSPLRNNWQAVAAELFLDYTTIQGLHNHGPDGMMDGVLQIMIQKRMTVGNLVGILRKIKRPDIIQIFIEAGLSEDATFSNSEGNSQEELNNTPDEKNIQTNPKSPKPLVKKTTSRKRHNNNTIGLTTPIQNTSRSMATPTDREQTHVTNTEIEPSTSRNAASYGIARESSKVKQHELEKKMCCVEKPINGDPFYGREGQHKPTLEGQQPFSGENSSCQDREDASLTKKLSEVKI